jgi:hypothetical protein
MCLGKHYLGNEAQQRQNVYVRDQQRFIGGFEMSVSSEWRVETPSAVGLAYMPHSRCHGVHLPVQGRRGEREGEALVRKQALRRHGFLTGLALTPDTEHTVHCTYPDRHRRHHRHHRHAYSCKLVERRWLRWANGTVRLDRVPIPANRYWNHCARKIFRETINFMGSGPEQRTITGVRGSGDNHCGQHSHITPSHSYPCILPVCCLFMHVIPKY